MPRTLLPLILAAVVGSALTFGVIGLMSMAQSPTNMLDHVLVGYGPSPRDMVQIRQGTPYTVPTGKVLVLTGLGDRGVCGAAIQLYVNGQQEVLYIPVSGVGSSVASIPSGLTVAGGSTISLGGGCTSDFTAGRAWGYLSNG